MIYSIPISRASALLESKDHGLMKIRSQVDTKMGRLDLPTQLIGIHVKPIQVGAHRLERILALDNVGCDVEHAVLQRMSLTDLDCRDDLTPSIMPAAAATPAANPKPMDPNNPLLEQSGQDAW